jgi:hypothetical protein
MGTVSAALCKQVDERDRYCCVRCGKSLHVTSGSRHHRQRRAPGLDYISNLILLCGSGTTGCHGWVHAHPEEARAAGWIVRTLSLLSPEETPLQVVSNGEHSPLYWVMLPRDGRRVRVPDVLAHVLIGPNL